MERIKKLKSLICTFWFSAEIVFTVKNLPCPPTISNHPWSTDFIRLVPRLIEALVSGCAEMGAKNHIVEKKNFVPFIFLGKKSGSQRILAVKIPKIITTIVSILYIGGRTKVWGLKERNKFCKANPATIAANLKVRVAVLI